MAAFLLCFCGVCCFIKCKKGVFVNVRVYVCVRVCTSGFFKITFRFWKCFCSLNFRQLYFLSFSPLIRFFLFNFFILFPPLKGKAHIQGGKGGGRINCRYKRRDKNTQTNLKYFKWAQTPSLKVRKLKYRRENRYMAKNSTEKIELGRRYTTTDKTKVAVLYTKFVRRHHILRATRTSHQSSGIGHRTCSLILKYLMESSLKTDSGLKICWKSYLRPVSSEEILKLS